MGRKLLCLMLALVLVMTLGMPARAQQTHFIRISELTYPAAGTTPEGFFLIFDVQSDLPDVELYGHSFSLPEGGEVTEFEAGKTYCLWLHLRRMEGDPLTDCDVAVEGEPAEEMLPFEDGWKVKKTFTIPAEEPPKEDPAPEIPTEPAPEQETQPEEPAQPELPTERPTEPTMPEETPTEPETQPEEPKEPESEQEENPKSEPENAPETEDPKPEAEAAPDTGPEPEELPDPSRQEDNPEAPPEEPEDPEEQEPVEEPSPKPEEKAPEEGEKPPQDSEDREAPEEPPQPEPEDEDMEETQPNSTEPTEKPENKENNSTQNEIEPEIPTGPSTEREITVLRIAGDDRYETAFAAADACKAQWGAEKLSCILVASGTAFPDALSGSYLAAVRRAPILLVKPGKEDAVKAYIRENLLPGGTVYLLGGERAVPKAMENGLDDFTVKRLGGADRYETNRLILQEAGVARKNMMICTGENFADALSASAVGMPILLVKDSLSTGQKDLLRHSGGGIYVLGGEKAVSAALETQLGIYGAVERLAGNTRYDTSARIARRFFPAAQAAVLAGGENFPDALCGGVLACAQGVPLLLIRPGAENTAWEGALSMVCVMGGIRAVPEDAVQSLIQRG